jgi:ABC-type Fe3+/spermidine/putrescine transport system ATPase subunit
MRLSSSKTSEGEFKTLDGGHTLHVAVSKDELAPLNKPVVLAIRPEHVQISANHDGAENSLRGTVREIVFAGATSTIRVDANGLLLEALVVQPDGVRVNEDCTLILRAEKLRLLREG